jgi:hypothetical protein
MKIPEYKLTIHLQKIIFCTCFCAALASATVIPGHGNTQPAILEESAIQPCNATGVELQSTASDTVAKTSLSKEQRTERVRQYIEKTIDDLNYTHSRAREDMERLGRLVDAMTPLEPLKREYDIRMLLDWYHRYSDGNMDMLAEYKDRLEVLMVYPGEGESLSILYAELAEKNRNFELELQGMIKKFDDELQHLFRIIERRQFLSDRLQILREQLSLVEDKSRQQLVKGKETLQSDIKLEQIKTEIRIVQTELVSLFDIKEELLKHYVVMIELGRDEAFWLDLKMGEYALLMDASRVIESSSSSKAPALAESYRRLIRGYESEIKKVNRRIEQLDRKRSRVSPAGSFRDLDRSRELAEFYLDRQQRYSDYINRLKVRIGNFEAEL